MDMRVLIGVSFLAAGMWGVAEEAVTQSTALGVLKVDSRQANTLVSVPWAGFSTSVVETGISVADVVKTANLTVGDQLLVYDKEQGAYCAWVLTLDAASEILGWMPTATVTAGGISVASAQMDAKLTRGQALWLIRQDVSRPFYLLGQYATGGVCAEIVGRGVAASGVAYTLLGNPGVEVLRFNDLDWGTGPVAGDQISIPDGAVPRRLKWDAEKGEWFRIVSVVENGRVVQKRRVDDEVAPGVGFWYIRNAATGFKFTWAPKVASMQE